MEFIQPEQEIYINVPQQDKIVQPQNEEINTDLIPKQQEEEEDVKEEINTDFIPKQEEEEEDDNDDNLISFKNMNKIRRQQKERIRKEKIKEEEKKRRKKEIEPPLEILHSLEQPQIQEEKIQYNIEPQQIPILQEKIQYNLNPQQIPNLEPGEILEPEQIQNLEPGEILEEGEIARTVKEIKDDEERLKKEIEDRERERRIKERKERMERRQQEKKLEERIRAISQEKGYRTDDDDLLSLSEYKKIPKREGKKRKKEVIGEKRERRPIIHKSQSKVVKPKPIVIKDPDSKILKKKIPPLVRTEQGGYGPSEPSYTSYSELVKEGIINDPDYLEGLKKKEDLNKKKKK